MESVSVGKSRQQPIRAMETRDEPTLIRSMGAAAVLATAAETPGQETCINSLHVALYRSRIDDAPPIMKSVKKP